MPDLFGHLDPRDKPKDDVLFCHLHVMPDLFGHLNHYWIIYKSRI